MSAPSVPETRIAPCAQSALANGGLLLLLLFAFRLERVVQLRLEPGPIDWVIALWPDVALLAAIEAFWLLVARIRRRWVRALWLPGFLATHAALYLVALASQQFFLHTGTRLDWTLLGYGIAHFARLRGLLGSGVDPGLVARAAVAALCFALGWREAVRGSGTPRDVSALLPALALVAAVGAVRAAPLPAGGALGLGGGFPALEERGLAAPGWRSDAWLAARIESPYAAPVLKSTRTARRPNVLLLILESMRTDVVAPYADAAGPPLTPFLARFAEQAFVWDTVYTSVPHTSKALVGILCGMYPVLVMPIVESVPGQLPLACAPALLRELGYRTHFLQTARGEFENRPGLLANLQFDDWHVQEDLDDGAFAKTGYFGMDEFAMLEPALAWVRRDAERPWFLTLLTVTTHHPYEVPERPEPEAEADDFAAYRAAVTHTDRFVAKLWERLEAEGLLDDTLVVVVGDHGEAFGEHLRRQHDVVPYEEAIRVPLLLRGPAWLGPPRRIGGLRHHVDLLPTLLGLLGAEWEGRLPGRSLLASPGHEAVFSSCWYDNYCLALRTGNLKYVFHYGRRAPEVFNLARDPHERQDLAAELPPALREAVERQLLVSRFSIDAHYRAHAPRRRALSAEGAGP